MSETYTAEDFTAALRNATVTAYSTGSETYTPSEPARSEEFERFEDLASKRIAVPKTEVSED